MSKTDNLEIIPLSPNVRDNKYNDIIERGRYAMVENYNENERDFERIKQYVFKNLDSNYQLYDTYEWEIYRPSGGFNRNFIDTPSDRIELHGKDRVLSFTWQKGHYIGHHRFKNGEIKDTANVQLIKIK